MVSRKVARCAVCWTCARANTRCTL
jgi:hypothetical protein